MEVEQYQFEKAFRYFRDNPINRFVDISIKVHRLEMMSKC